MDTVWTDGVTVTPGETLIVGVGTGGHPQRVVVQDYGGSQPPNGLQVLMVKSRINDHMLKDNLIMNLF